MTQGALKDRLSDAGALQLLLDVRLLRDVLSGGQPPGDSAGTAAAAALASRRELGTKVEALLSTRLDPIDWATYEPHLIGLAGQALQRCALLHGPLLQASRILQQRCVGGRDQGMDRLVAQDELGRGREISRLLLLMLSLSRVTSNLFAACMQARVVQAWPAVRRVDDGAGSGGP